MMVHYIFSFNPICKHKQDKSYHCLEMSYKNEEVVISVVVESESVRSALWAECRTTITSPVSEVQNGLDGISSTCTDVSLKSRKQRNHHKHPVLLLLSAEKTQRQYVDVNEQKQ